MTAKHNILKLLSIVAVVAMIFSGFQPAPVQAQSGDGIQRQVNAGSGRVSFISTESGKPLSAPQALETFIQPQNPAMALAKRFAPEFGVRDPETELAEMKKEQGENGRLTVKYQQRHQGIPVMGGELIVNTNENGDLYSMNGEVSPDLSLSTQPTITAEQAKGTALQSLAKWYQMTSNDFIATEPELWIFDESLLQSSTRPVELVWRMEVTPVDNGLPVRELVLVNAQRGGISLHFNQVDTAWSASTNLYGNLQDTRLTPTPTPTDIFPTPISELYVSPEPEETLLLASDEPREVQAEPLDAQVEGLTGTLYVITTGNDSNSCSAADTPCATINGALAKASAGDTILVAEGVYEVISIVKSITLSGGWDPTFTTQLGYSTIDGQNEERGISVSTGLAVTIRRFIVKHGSAANGAGISMAPSSTVVLDNMIIFDNHATIDSQGGGINNAGVLTINNSLIYENTAYEGGALSAGTNSITTINNSGIFSNSATYGGGIKATSISSLTINNTTIGNNTATKGGGIYSFAGSQAIQLKNVTISYNHASVDGGGIMSNVSTVTTVLRNTILAKNTATNEPLGGNCSVLTLNLAYRDSIIYPQNICSLSEGWPIHVDPQLGKFIPSRGYYPLLSSSPAINAGSSATCTAADQRGVPRSTGGGCDIGAYEYTVPGPLAGLEILEGNNQQASLMRYFRIPLKIVAIDSLGSPVPNTNLTFTAPDNGASATFDNNHTNITSTYTDAGGFAIISDLKANGLEGAYSVLVSTNDPDVSEVFSLSNTSSPIDPEFLTYNALFSKVLPGSLICTGSSASCTNGTYPRADYAHMYAIGTYNFYLAKHDRDSLDNKNMAIVSSINYCSTSPYICPYANAFWNGEQVVYGAAYEYPMADDVVAHELTHGVTDYESNLFYYYQSGAINESFSDLWGEYYDQTNGLGNDTEGVKWRIGEDIGDAALQRSMSNPPAYNDPDKMTSPYYQKLPYYDDWWDNGGVHTNSGVNNKAVYLLVDGGTFNGKTVTGLGWDKVGAIYYEVQTNLLASGADYSDLYYALQQACTNLIGQKGITAGDCTEVKDAVDAVQMNAQPVANYNPDAPLCTTSSPVVAFSDDLETGAGKWFFLNNGFYTRWQYDSPWGQYAQSGEHFLYADDYPQSLGQNTDAIANWTSFVVPNSAYLHFAQAYEFEFDPSGNYDGGVLEYSTNGGATWVDAGPLMDYNGYRGKISTGYSNPLKGKMAFVGSSHGYISTRVNLSSLAGKTVSFRWRMGLDEYGVGVGWWVDNIKVYTCGPATIFMDVPSTHPYYQDIEILYANGLTAGCVTTPLKFCPDQIMDRAQSAVFMLRGNFGIGYTPPTVLTHRFSDNWTPGLWAEKWAEGMYNANLTAGCTVSGPLKFCPWEQMPREQAVIFGLKLKYGKDYNPPAATGTVFADMADTSYYATKWAEQGYADGLLPACGMSGGKPKFCPQDLVSRGLAAYMIVRAKDLTMP